MEMSINENIYNLLNKSKVYNFSKTGYMKAKRDYVKEKGERIGSMLFWGVFGVLVLDGIIGSKAIVIMGVSNITGRSVRWMVRKGII